MKNFYEALRYEYDLNPNSVVMDVGAYHGEFSREIAKRYGCHIFAYEPVMEFFVIAAETLHEINRVALFNVGWSDKTEIIEFGIHGSMTGRFCGDEKRTKVELRDVAEMLPTETDLLKLNCEGSEYRILSRMLDLDLVKSCRNIQVQFHDLAGNKEDEIIQKLLETHHFTYNFPYVWSNFERNK